MSSMRDRTDLIAALEPVFYELQQFVCLLRIRLMAPAKSGGNRALAQLLLNACLEALLLHARILVEFFQTQDNGNKVRATHYQFEGMAVVLDKQVVQRLHNDLAHLSYDRLRRLEPKNRGWSAAEFLPLLTRCSEFLDFLKSTTYVAEAQFGSCCDQLRDTYQRTIAAVEPGDQDA